MPSFVVGGVERLDVNQQRSLAENSLRCWFRLDDECGSGECKVGAYRTRGTPPFLESNLNMWRASMTKVAPHTWLSCVRPGL